jgi:hypothetical protein
MLSSEDTNQEYWSVVANIKREQPYGAGGIEIRNGTKQFKGGAKVYIIGSYPGMCDSLKFVQTKSSKWCVYDHI